MSADLGVEADGPALFAELEFVEVAAAGLDCRSRCAPLYENTVGALI